MIFHVKIHTVLQLLRLISSLDLHSIVIIIESTT